MSKTLKLWEAIMKLSDHIDANAMMGFEVSAPDELGLVVVTIEVTVFLDSDYKEYTHKSSNRHLRSMLEEVTEVTGGVKKFIDNINLELMEAA